MAGALQPGRPHVLRHRLLADPQPLIVDAPTPEELQERMHEAETAALVQLPASAPAAPTTAFPLSFDRERPRSHRQAASVAGGLPYPPENPHHPPEPPNTP